MQAYAMCTCFDFFVLLVLEMKNFKTCKILKWLLNSDPYLINFSANNEDVENSSATHL